MGIGLPQYTSHSDTYARCPALPGPVWSAAREGDVLGFELTCRERRFATRRDQQHLNGLAHLKVRVPGALSPWRDAAKRGRCLAVSRPGRKIG